MSIDQRVVPDVVPQLDYRGLFGWPVRWHNGELMLVTGSGIGAVTVPKALADRVLDSLARQGCSGPAVNVPTKRGTVVMLLVETDALTFDDTPLPEGVQVLPTGSGVPLPGNGPGNLARWLVAPDEHQRWLPSLAAVLASIRSVARGGPAREPRWDHKGLTTVRPRTRRTAIE
ncbi:hypothetical protein ABZ863_04840 [Saccharomonospora sp. NPDC046836]|uniref:hypothetical protein n=1 Tax=Saccharomonospora sp. NPDC046836 TaxID=3156921 RepID=UPI0033CDC42B